jgi:hypothetical protein
MKVTIEKKNEKSNIAFNIDISQNRKICELKTLIYLKTKVPFCYQEIWFNDLLLKDDDLLHLNHTKLTLVVKLKRH